MPFKSEAQRKYLWMKKKEGKLPGVNLHEWAAKTKGRLPEHVRHEKKGASSITSLIERLHEKGEAEKLLKKKKELAEANAKMLARQKALGAETKSAYVAGLRDRFADAGLDPDAAMRWFKIG